MQLEFFDVPSPCVGICQSDQKGQCLGCFRTREERQTWQTLTADDKQKVIKRCIQRKKRKEKKALVKAAEEEAINPQPSLLDPPPNPAVNSDTNTDIDFGDFEL